MHLPGCTGCYPPVWFFYFRVLSSLVTVLTGYCWLLLHIIAYCYILLPDVIVSCGLVMTDGFWFWVFLFVRGRHVLQSGLVAGTMSGFQAGWEIYKGRQEGPQLPKWSWGFRGSEWIKGSFCQFFLEKTLEHIYLDAQGVTPLFDTFTLGFWHVLSLF